MTKIKNTLMIRNHKNCIFKNYSCVKSPSNSIFWELLIPPKFFWWFLIMIVFFSIFLQNFYNSLARAINFPHGLMTKNWFWIFDTIFKLFLWQNQKRYTKSYNFRKSRICKKWLFLFYNFFQNFNLFLSCKHLTSGIFQLL